MNGNSSGRGRQTWILFAVCMVLFAFLIWFIQEMTWSLWGRVMIAAVFSSGVCIALFQLWLRSALSRRNSAIVLLNRITAGDLSLNAPEIREATQSARMSAALRALVSNLERTIRRFAQLALDVSTVSQQISGRSRVLARSAGEQLVSTESTSASVGQIDQSINNVRENMEQLSANAEETSTSVLEMSASIEEVSRIADTLAASFT
jgi:methyl-accepting chemotaxis protein